MEFFVPCWILLGLMFGETPSKSYVGKQSKTFASRLAVCNDVALAAVKGEVDPILAISVAYSESRFSHPTSKKGAKGPLGVLPKYHCDDPKSCDYTQAGVDALRKFLEINEFNYCKALAQFNRGLGGKCEKGRPEYTYATYILGVYEELCEKTGMCEAC